MSAVRFSGCQAEARSAPLFLPRPAAKGRQASGASGGDICANAKGAGHE